MPTAQTNPDRPSKVSQRMQDRGFNLLSISALVHIAEHDTRNCLEHASKPQMHQHPIPLVRLHPNILKKQNPTPRTSRIRSPQRLRIDRATPTRQFSLTNPCTQHPQSIDHTQFPLARSLKRGYPTNVIHRAFCCLFPLPSSLVFTKIGRHHRPLKTHKLTLISQPHMQRSLIAITNERLRIRPHQLSIEQRQQLRRPPPTPRANHRIHLRISEGRMKIGSTLLCSPCIVKRSSIKRMRKELCLVPKRMQRLDTCSHKLSLRRARGRNYAERSACSYRFRLDHTHR